jgi:hypothetical protein
LRGDAELRTAVHSEHEVNFGGGGPLCIGCPILTADGDSEVTPMEYPGKGLRKNSLIARITGKQTIYYQGGTKNLITPFESGNLELLPNDVNPMDNQDGWNVKVQAVPPPPSP